MEDYEDYDLEIGDEFTTEYGETLRVVGFEANGCPICKPLKNR